jgi:hypothetical protein
MEDNMLLFCFNFLYSHFYLLITAVGFYINTCLASIKETGKLEVSSTGADLDSI